MSGSLAEKPPCSADLCVFFWRWRDADFLSALWFAHSCIGRSREREREGAAGSSPLVAAASAQSCSSMACFSQPAAPGGGGGMKRNERKGGIIKGIKRKLLDVKRVRY